MGKNIGKKCFICGEQTKYKAGSFTLHHLKKIHNIEPKDYFDLYVDKGKTRYCELCGKEKRFISLDVGYKEFCSDVKCNAKNEKILKKIEDTKLEKYGDSHYVNRDKAKKTMKEKYGQELYTNRNKAKKTMEDKYGTSNIMEVQEFKDKCLESKSRKKIKFYSEEIDDCEMVSLSEQTLKVKCKKCKNESELDTKLVYTRRKYGITLCLHCFPLCDMNTVSYGEKEIYEFIKENYKGEIVTKCRDVISKEIDIYLPELKLGFEYNGFYWHCDKKKDKNYHKYKTDECENKGVRLIHIFEDEWKWKGNIVKSKILNLLGKTPNKIGARNCEIVENVPVKEQIIFYDKNHIQGYVRNKQTIGLKFGNQYVAMMSFSSNRNKHKYDEELVRFATKRDTVVNGGFNKLFKFYHKEGIKIVSYADRCWSYGGVYEKCGFVKEKVNVPSYFYAEPNKLREHRFKYRKDNLKKMGYDVEGKTEFEIVDSETNLLRIYNSGTIVYTFV